MSLQIAFYHLTKSPLEKSLPKLLEKVLLAKHKVIVRTRDENLLTSLDNLLWTYTTKFFLPHGKADDAYAYMHPVIITNDNNNPNGANVLALLDDADSSDVSKFEKCLYMFDGNNANQLRNARLAWKNFKEAGYELKYWQQEDNGNWKHKEL